MNIVEVRNVKLGSGIPKICVPLVGKNDDELTNEIKKLKDIEFDLVEWRIDFYEEILNINKLINVSKNIRELLGDVPILATFRTAKEGGEKNITNGEYIELYKKLCENKYIDLIDVELFTGDNIVKEVIDNAHRNNIKVIMSNHDFNKTPSKDEILKRLLKMQELNADIPKIAVMPQSSEDVLSLLNATNEMVTKYAKSPIITMSMSGLGVISRISGEIFGSCLTFGAAQKASAPGQINAVKLKDILDEIYNNI